jgi:predicted DNA-binding transcriptional regulator AlpA
MERDETLAAVVEDRQTEEGLWDVSDVMAFLKVSDTTVRRRVDEGLPAKRIGGMLRFVPAEVRAWAREQVA